MILGLRTAIYPVSNLRLGKRFYTDLLGTPPYFDEPYYVGYKVGGFELGLIPDGVPGDAGGQAYWGVPDLTAELTRILALGAKLHEAARDVGSGILVAAVIDPFGNVLHLIENPHFDPKAVR